MQCKHRVSDRGLGFACWAQLRFLLAALMKGGAGGLSPEVVVVCSVSLRRCLRQIQPASQTSLFRRALS